MDRIFFVVHVIPELHAVRRSVWQNVRQQTTRLPCRKETAVS